MKAKNEMLEHLKPGPHPMRSFFRRHGVTYAMLAKHCNCSVGWIGQLMAGYRPIPLHLAGKLYDLAERLEPGVAESMLDPKVRGAKDESQAA